MGSLLFNALVMMLCEKGRTWNAAAVWLQLSSSQQQNVCSEKRLTTNALTRYHQWLLLSDGRMVICHFLVTINGGSWWECRGHCFVLRWPFRWAWTGTVWLCDGRSQPWGGRLPPASKSLISGMNINWLLLFSTPLVVNIWNTEVRRILKSVEQKPD